MSSVEARDVSEATLWAMPDNMSLRVLAFADWYGPDSSGGAERAAHEIYRRVAGAGADVRVISEPYGAEFVDPGVEVVRCRGINVSRLVGGSLVVVPSVFLKAFTQARAFRPHVIHVNTIHYNGSIAAAIASRILRIPIVTTMQLGGSIHLPLRSRLPLQFYERTMGRFVLRSSERILAVSNAVRHHAISLGARPEWVSVVENGVDHERFSAPELQPQRVPRIMFVGRLTPNKGPDLLVKAVIALARRERAFTVDFVGDGPLRSSLEDAVAHADLSDRVRFLGHVGDVDARLRDADIVVRPSYTEGLPLAVLEAMAAGRCNVVSDIAPNLELITDAVNGLTFRVGDADSFAEALDRVITDATLRCRLAHRAAVDSRTRSWDRMASETALALMAAGNHSKAAR